MSEWLGKDKEIGSIPSQKEHQCDSAISHFLLLFHLPD